MPWMSPPTWQGVEQNCLGMPVGQTSRLMSCRSQTSQFPQTQKKCARQCRWVGLGQLLHLPFSFWLGDLTVALAGVRKPRVGPSYSVFLRLFASPFLFRGAQTRAQESLVVIGRCASAAVQPNCRRQAPGTAVGASQNVTGQSQGMMRIASKRINSLSVVEGLAG
jgi:hypothetical protein